MSTDCWSEKLVETRVIYTLEINGQLIVVENVPARVNVETGEQLFSPETVERLQKMIWRKSKPKRMIRVPVYEYV
ncbi:MAG: YgiT-type zinc finger protein [Thermoflexales bacterium]|nr:YgiT-type zinc finger protein [Thermoflexales bacterium]